MGKASAQYSLEDFSAITFHVIMVIPRRPLGGERGPGEKPWK